jgi:hypothetical protein
MNSTNPDHPGWYITFAHGQKFLSHFDGKAWGVGWHDRFAAIGKEHLAHNIAQKDWSHEVDVTRRCRPTGWPIGAQGWKH